MAAIASLRAVVVQRHGEARADGEGVVARDAARAERGERGGGVAVDAQLDELGAETGEQGRGVSRATIAAGVHDRDAVAESLGLVEVVGREQNRQLVATAAGRRSRRAARRGCAGRVRPSARRGTARAGVRRARVRSPAAAARRRCSCRRAGRRARRARASRRAPRSARSASAGSTPQRRAWMSRLRRPVSERSTAGSWKTTLLTRARRERLRLRRRSPRAGRCRPSARWSSSASRGRRFAGAVRAEQAEHLARRDLEVDACRPPRRRPGRSCGGRSTSIAISCAPCQAVTSVVLVRHADDGSRREDVTVTRRRAGRRRVRGAPRPPARRSPTGCSAR